MGALPNRFSSSLTPTLSVGGFFGFAVTPNLLLQGLVYALIMGLLGGIIPAIRAARLPISKALREL